MWRASPIGGGALNVDWTEAANATGYIVIAINATSERSTPTSLPFQLTMGGVDNWNSFRP